MIVTGPAVGHWVASRIGGFFDPVCMVAIGWQRDDGVLTAGVAYRDWNGASLEAEVVVEGSLVPAFVRAAFWYPFVQLGARKIRTTTAANRDASIRQLVRMGFTQEARLRDAAPEGDLLIFVLDAANCRFLGDRRHGHESQASAAA